MSEYPHYTLNFADGSHFKDDAAAKKAISEAVKAGKAHKPAGVISIGVKGSHTTFMDIGGHRVEIGITHHNEDKDREPTLDIIIKPV